MEGPVAIWNQGYNILLLKVSEVGGEKENLGDRDLEVQVEYFSTVPW